MLILLKIYVYIHTSHNFSAERIFQEKDIYFHISKFSRTATHISSEMRGWGGQPSVDDAWHTGDTRRKHTRSLVGSGRECMKNEREGKIVQGERWWHVNIWWEAIKHWLYSHQWQEEKTSHSHIFFPPFQLFFFHSASSPDNLMTLNSISIFYHSWWVRA